MEKKQKKFKFNIIDVIVILVILAVVAFFAIRFIDFEQAQPNTGTQQISYVVRSVAMPKEVYEEVAAKLPAQMISNGSFIDGTIEEAVAYPCTVTDIEYHDGADLNSTYHVLPEGEYVTVDFICSARISTGSLLNNVGSQEVRVGRTHYVKGIDIEFDGTVISVERSAE